MPTEPTVTFSDCCITGSERYVNYNFILSSGDLAVMKSSGFVIANSTYTPPPLIMDDDIKIGVGMVTYGTFLDGKKVLLDQFHTNDPPWKKRRKGEGKNPGFLKGKHRGGRL